LLGKFAAIWAYKCRKRIFPAARSAFSLSPPRLATLDQPLGKGFADETGLVELLH
jgi:hypothetical protein